MVANIIRRTVNFPFKLLEEFLTAIFFPNLAFGNRWEITPTRREQAQRQTIKRLSRRLVAERYAHQQDAVYWHRMMREQEKQHREDMEKLEKRYRDREK